MPLALYNTATRDKQIFAPIDEKRVRAYLCGPTVYDRIHVGNARAFTVFDLLIRLLHFHYGREHVVFVRNITDIDDKIALRAKERKIPIGALTAETIEDFHRDVAELNLLVPDIEPRATDHIAEMIAMISVLIGKRHAYEAEGHVLFHVPSFPDYGALSRRATDDLLAGARVDIAPFKRDPMDFVLWKPSNDDQPGFASPFGRGRPGWHIECSAMARRHLGDRFDIHGGGIDLIFPHHENELAQSVCAGAEGFVNVWVHNGFLTVEAEKMSKSLGNFLTLREALEQAPGEVVRYALLMAHYRQPADWSDANVREARLHLDRWYRLTDGVEASRPAQPVVEALDDDLNTPKAFAELHRLSDDPPALKASAQLMGFLRSDARSWFQGAEASKANAIEALILRRNEARKARNFAEADRIRDELAAQGVILEDQTGKTIWRMQ
jgi:cysteinyl-tRNA synthetase